MSKQPRPTPEELEFVYRLILSGYDDQDVLGEYTRLFESRELVFPLRSDKRFVKERRKELAAAEAALKERIKKSVDPVIAKKREEHFDRLASIVHELPTAFVCLEDVRRSEDGEYLVGEGSDVYRFTRADLCLFLQENLDIVRHEGPYVGTDDFTHEHEYWPDFDLVCLEAHLKEEYSANPACGSKGLAQMIEENPYELIEVLRLLSRRKTFKGKCEVCKDW